jgi:Ca2+/Na+ antiporter
VKAYLRGEWINSVLTITDKLIYSERISSNKTEILFLVLSALFAFLTFWRVKAAGVDILAIVLLILFCVFVFYSVNYRTLKIQITPERLNLKFGIFTRTILLSNIETCSLDEIPTLLRMGGAGIHFMRYKKRYRASFNFLEYPRVVIVLKRKTGPVQEISFSTRQPSEFLHLVQEKMETH